MCESSEAILVAKAAQDDTLPDAVSLGLEKSYEWADFYFRAARYGAARAMVWPFTRPKSAQGVDVVVAMTTFLAVIDWAAQDYDRASRTLVSVSPLVATLSDRVVQGKHFNARAMCEEGARRFEQAFAFYRDSLDCYTLAGARRYADDVENNIGALLIRTGHPKAADPYITRAVQSCDDPLTLAQILDTRARQELAFGHFDEARQLITDAITTASKLTGADTYLAGFARTFADINTAEAASMERSFSGVRIG